jgi:hypothetical protein
MPEHHVPWHVLVERLEESQAARGITGASIR